MASEHCVCDEGHVCTAPLGQAGHCSVGVAAGHAGRHGFNLLRCGDCACEVMYPEGKWTAPARTNQPPGVLFGRCMVPVDRHKAIVGDGNMYKRSNPITGREWMQTFWEPCVACAPLRLGRIGDGGKWICPALVSKDCHMISVGSNNDFSFEVKVHEELGCSIDTIDGTSSPPKVPMPYLTFHKKMFSKAMFLEVVDKPIDIFKIDCEGCEAGIFSDPDVLARAAQYINQIQIELHWNKRPYRALGTSSHALYLMWANFAAHGFEPFHKEPNIQYADGTCIELALLNTAMVAPQ